jgi:hypothetical protein
VVSRTSHVVGPGAVGNKPKITSKSCGPQSKCWTLDIPGPTK